MIVFDLKNTLLSLIQAMILNPCHVNSDSYRGPTPFAAAGSDYWPCLLFLPSVTVKPSLSTKHRQSLEDMFACRTGKGAAGG
jgi:hypothetical protein